MRNRVVLVPHSYPYDGDRASDQLAKLGYKLDWRCAFDGDVLGDLQDDVAGTIVYGGMYDMAQIPKHPFLQDEIRWLQQCMDAGLPTLGICQGAQMIAHILGADVGPHPDGLHEYGYYEIEPLPGAQDFLPEPLHVVQGHFHGFDMPKGAKRLAKSKTYPNQAFQWKDHVFGVQFHPEVTDSFLEEHWLSQDWSEEASRQPNAQPLDVIRAGKALYEPAQDAWFRDFLTKLFGPAPA